MVVHAKRRIGPTRPTSIAAMITALPGGVNCEAMERGRPARVTARTDSHRAARGVMGSIHSSKGSVAPNATKGTKQTMAAAISMPGGGPIIRTRRSRPTKAMAKSITLVNFIPPPALPGQVPASARRSKVASPRPPKFTSPVAVTPAERMVSATPPPSATARRGSLAASASWSKQSNSVAIRNSAMLPPQAAAMCGESIGSSRWPGTACVRRHLPAMP